MRDDGSFLLMFWPDISRVCRVTSDVVSGMSVTKFIGIGHVANFIKSVSVAEGNLFFAVRKGRDSWCTKFLSTRLRRAILRLAFSDAHLTVPEVVAYFEAIDSYVGN